MAFTQEKISTNVVGSKRVEVYKCTLTGVTSGTLLTGLKRIDIATFNNDTTEGDGLVVPNSSNDGEAALSGFTSGDVVRIRVEGL
jgi:hypothetical protein